MSALLSMQSLTTLDLGDCVEQRPQLLPLLCTDAATLLLLRLKWLALPSPLRGEGRELDEPYNAFLCRLSSLPATPALQHFSDGATHHAELRAAGLLSIFSLPHLKLLDLRGTIRRSQLSAFIAGFLSAPAPLECLVVPSIQAEPGDGGRDETTITEDAGAVCSAVRLLLSRLATLRSLDCDAEMVGGASALPGSKPNERGSGSSGSLYCLCLRPPRPSCLPCIAPLSFPLLTELSVWVAITAAELELLLPACPQLLKLSCTSRSWKVVHTAARCCPCLLALTVVNDTPEQEMDDGEQEPSASPFLPQLIKLRLYHGNSRRQPFFSDFSVLRHFTSPPHLQLRHVLLDGDGLTAQHVLSLACLPRLSQLMAQSGDGIEELEEASRRTRQQLLARRAAGYADRDADRLIERMDARDCGQKRCWLGPHQQREMRQRMLDDAVASKWEERNLLASMDGVERDEVRAVFFSELRSVLTPTVASRVIERRRRW
jgi:hypothetical protein